MTEAPFTTRKQRKQLAQYLFEKRSMPFMHFATQAVLGLFSVGLDTGVVMDIGDGVTQVVPVVEGYSISQSIKRIDLGGRCVAVEAGRPQQWVSCDVQESLKGGVMCFSPFVSRLLSWLCILQPAVM